MATEILRLWKSILDLLGRLEKVVINQGADIISNKAQIITITTVHKTLLRLANITGLKLHTLNQQMKAESKDMKNTFDSIEHELGIDKCCPVLTTGIIMPIDIGHGITIDAMMYKSKEEIPVMSYGCIITGGKPLVVFRVSSSMFVSCTSFEISDSVQCRTIACSSTDCKYGKNCKFFHDPVRSDDGHIQNFPRTLLVKSCPYFGHYDLFEDHQKFIKPSNLITLARYCASMLMLINKVVKNKE